MADKKTTQEVSGAPITGADLFRIARPGANYKLTSEEIFSETIDVAVFNNYIATNALIPGRWYRVTGLDNGSCNGIATIMAETTNTFHPHGFYEGKEYITNNSLGKVWGEFAQQNLVDPIRGTDEYGNLIYYPFSNNLYFSKINVNFQSNEIYSVIGSAANANSIVRTSIKESQINCPELSIEFCEINNSSLSSGGASNTLSSTKVLNSFLSIQNGSQVSNCHFENCFVTIINGADVQGLTIIGKNFDNTPSSYTIDGTYQSQVWDKWSGTVIADNSIENNGVASGTSNVKLNLIYNDTYDATPGIFETNTGTIFTLPNSVVGIYILPNLQNSGIQNIQFVSDGYYYPNHEIKIEATAQTNGGQYHTTFIPNKSSITSSQDILEYHSMAAKVGELHGRGDFMILRAGYMEGWNDIAWYLVYGSHYDL